MWVDGLLEEGGGGKSKRIDIEALWLEHIRRVGAIPLSRSSQMDEKELSDAGKLWGLGERD